MNCIELSGLDRIEFSPELNRVIRMGSVEDLAISNADRVRSFLDSRNYADASKYLSYLHGMDTHMIAALIEWCHQWQNFVDTRIPLNAAAIKQAAIELWKQQNCTKELEGAALQRTVEATLRSTEGGAQVIDRVKCAQSTILSALISKFNTLEIALNGNSSRCKELFEEYLQATRACHDWLTNYCWSISTCVLQQSGQQTAEDGIRASFGACSFHEPSWTMFSALKPALLAAVLAEHLRAHFSGPGRDGNVTIVEEAKAYKILMEPCGSGGAMRRSPFGNAMGKFELPSPSTWGRSDVPAYCAHCALNEEYSKRHFGRALWTTEFNPDDTKPCCWSIPKYTAT